MYFTNPIKKFEARSSGLMDTHPPILDRINRLRQLTGDPPLGTSELAPHAQDALVEPRQPRRFGRPERRIAGQLAEPVDPIEDRINRSQWTGDPPLGSSERRGGRGSASASWACGHRPTSDLIRSPVHDSNPRLAVCAGRTPRMR